MQTIVLGVFGILFLFSIQKRIEYIKNRTAVALFIFFFTALFTSLFSSYPLYAIKKASGLFFETFFALLLGMYSAEYSEDIKKYAIHFFVIFAGVVLILYLISPYKFSPLINRHGVLTGFLGGKLTYPGVITSFGSVITEKLSYRCGITICSAALIFLLTLAFNGSRSYIVGVFLSAITLLVINIKKLKNTFIPALILGTLLILIIPQSRARILSMEPGRMDKSIQIRFHLWEIGMDVVKKHPLTGIGFETWPLFADSIINKSEDTFLKSVLTQNNIDTRAVRGHLHNTYLMMLVNGGVILFVSFIYLIFTMLKEAFLLEDRMKFALLFMLITFFIAGFSEYNFSDTEVIHSVFFFTGLYLGGKRS